MRSRAQLLILGGGVAGLAAGFYARQRHLSFRILEAGNQPGGNARTLEHGPFRFDTGAHRLHDRHPDITRDVQGLLGPDLLEVDAPSQISVRHMLVDFPLTPLNLIRTLGPRLSSLAAWDLLTERLRLSDDTSGSRAGLSA